MSKILNSLLQAWPPGTIVQSSWLARQGVSPSLATRYRKSGWVESVGRGAFARHGDRLGWEGAVYALQAEPGATVHPGGRTALELLGYAHFPRLAARRAVFLYSGRGERLATTLRILGWSIIHLAHSRCAFLPLSRQSWSGSTGYPTRGHLKKRA